MCRLIVRTRKLAYLAMALMMMALVTSAGLPPAAAQDVADGPHLDVRTCPEGTLPSGAEYRICIPDPWNKDVVVFAHGFVDPREPLHIPTEQLVLPSGTSVIDTVTSFGFAFATTTYRSNGLAVRQGMNDIVDLIHTFKTQYPMVENVYLVGRGEGALIATLLAEKRFRLFDRNLSANGPIGDFQQYVNYVGDFRVVFDYFFPDLIPGTVVNVPTTIYENWESYYTDTVEPTITDPANAGKVAQLISVTRAAVNPDDPSTTIKTINVLLTRQVLWTADLQNKLGGQPYYNATRVYVGSDDDVALNLGVGRFTADAAAQKEITNYYRTNARPYVPTVTMHNRLDPLVPYAQSVAYGDRVKARWAKFWYAHVPGERYAHCNYSRYELAQALETLLDLDAGLRVPGLFTIAMPIAVRTE